jgi:hypothetical protein
VPDILVHRPCIRTPFLKFKQLRCTLRCIDFDLENNPFRFPWPFSESRGRLCP